MKSRYGRVLLLVWAPAILLALLVGLARADYPDRYGPGVALHRRPLLLFLPFPAGDALRFVPEQFQIAALGYAGRARWSGGGARRQPCALPCQCPARAISKLRAARSSKDVCWWRRSVSSPTRPLVLTDASIPMDGAHRNALTLAFLIYSEYPRGIPGVRFVQGPLGAQQAAIESSLLKPWARAASSAHRFQRWFLRRRPDIRILLVGTALPLDGRARRRSI